MENKKTGHPSVVPLPSHPGHVFLEGEDIVLRAPGAPHTPWELRDHGGRLIRSGSSAGTVSLGRLPAGYYELRAAAPACGAWQTSLGVLTPLKCPTPESSPIAVDVAMSWFFEGGKDLAQWEAAASLCALAGVKWVRDRLTWRELEPEPGRFAEKTRYDTAADIQTAAGLCVLQVNHSSPPWANPNPKRFPLDLRHTFTLHRELARRWRGRVLAFEPWNEPDHPGFGGHTGSEMASLQKAAFLGAKSGAAGAQVCMSVLARKTDGCLQDLKDNGIGPYIEMFNIHHYRPISGYPAMYAAARAVAGAKPVWVTECSINRDAPPGAKEPTVEEMRIQAEQLPAIFAAALHEGPARVFYFLLPAYLEERTFFGLLNADLTPRPAYLALAAVGRLLADARPRGRLASPAPSVQGYLFDASPDGRPSEVLVAWSDGGETPLDLPAAPAEVYDHLGRRRAWGPLTSAPAFAVFHESCRLALIPPPVKVAPAAPEAISTVVLQAQWPEADVVLSESAYAVGAGQTVERDLYVYNFSSKPLQGRLQVSPPEGWRMDCAGEIAIAPLDRGELRLRVSAPPAASSTPETARIRGDFGEGVVSPVLTLRLLSR